MTTTPQPPTPTVSPAAAPAQAAPVTIDKEFVIKRLRELAQLLTLKGEIVHKIRAYENAAQTLVATTEDLGQLIAQGKLEELQGFGKSTTARVTELWTTGKMQLYEDLTKEFPATLLQIIDVPGVGPKKTLTLYHELGVKDLAGLEKACKDQKVRTLKGFGEKTEKSILDGLALAAKHHGRTPLHKARPMAEAVLAFVKKAPGIIRAEIGGSTRRFAETVGDVDVLASVKTQAEADDVMKHFLTMPGIVKNLGSGHTKTSVLLDDGLQLDLRVIEDADFGTAIHHFTGSKAHHVALRAYALKHQLTLSEYGAFKLKPDGTPGQKLSIKDEHELYAKLGLAYIPPELREGLDEIEKAEKPNGLGELVELQHVQGSIHQHTTFSDGKNTVEEMCRAAAERGLKYLTITDHSQVAHYANGVSVERLKHQWDEIDRVNDLNLGCVLLKGAEVDILDDGRLDYPEEVLARLDIVIGSIHSRFKMDIEQMTERLSKAFDNPHLHVWGHATGRLIGEREPYALHMEKLLDKAAAKGIAIEINGSPDRLDLSSNHTRMALERKIKLMLSTDAHSVPQLDNLRFAVGTALKAGVTRQAVLNTLPLPAFLHTLKHMRH